MRGGFAGLEQRFLKVRARNMARNIATRSKMTANSITNTSVPASEGLFVVSP